MACAAPQGGGDLVWVHDYQRFPLGRRLRDLGARCPIGFFLHVPFPPPTIFMALPGAGPLLESLAAYDLLGTQTAPDAQHLNVLLAARGAAVRARVFRIGLVTPLRDGMNLVAKEYVASQDAEDPGVLVLSRFAGAAEELREALLVNPYDPDEIAEALHKALTMKQAERRALWEPLSAALQANTAAIWAASFLEALTRDQESSADVIEADVEHA